MSRSTKALFVELNLSVKEIEDFKQVVITYEIYEMSRKEIEDFK